jgi:hypothetical protein
MELPEIVPLIIPAFFNSDKCLETVDCDKGKNSTMSPQIQVGELIKNFTISKRAGCPNAFRISDISIVSSEKPIFFVIPISQYYDIVLDTEKYKRDLTLI